MNVLEVFELACHSAGTVSQPRQRHVEIAVDKGGGDYATTADIDAGTAMEATIKYNMPDIPIVPEENKVGESDVDFRARRQAILDSGTFVLMDDLDATVCYRHGGEDWGHILGLVQNNVLTHCAMYMPTREVMVTAELRKGCFVNGKRQLFDHPLTVDQCLLYLPFHKDIHPTFHRDVATRILYIAKPSGCVCLNSNIGGIVRLVQGELGGFLGCGHNWDFVGALAVTEAGGVAVSPTGSDLKWNQIPMILVAAANRHIADAMLAVTKMYPYYGGHFWDNPKFQA